MTKQLPDFHRGYITGIRDTKEMVDALVARPFDFGEVDKNAVLTIEAACEIFKSNLETISQAIEAKANRATEIATQAMTNQGGVA